MTTSLALVVTDQSDILRNSCLKSKSIARRSQHTGLGCLIEDKKSKSNKGHFESSPLIVWIDLWIVNTYSEFQVNIFSNNRDITKYQSFCTTTSTTDNNDAKAIAIVTSVFSENSRANKSFLHEIAIDMHHSDSG